VTAAFRREIVALLPAAGRATRLGDLPWSKELLPVVVAGDSGPTVLPACQWLLDRFAAASVDEMAVVLRPEKQDLQAYLERRAAVSGASAGLASGLVSGLASEPSFRVPPLTLIETAATASLPETLERARSWVGQRWTVLGFPDCIFHPQDALTRLVGGARETSADAFLGLFPCPNPRATDLVDLAPDGRVRAIQVRPEKSALRLNWLLAAWGPRFTDLLQQAVAAPATGSGELQLGALFQRALEQGLTFEGMVFEGGRYWDIGTPAGYAAALREVPAGAPTGAPDGA
jgi:glucose-1-phosphate thymidylyltransferase